MAAKHKKRRKVRRSLKAADWRRLILLILMLFLGCYCVSRWFIRPTDRSQMDRICYLTAKYESNGHAESVGADVDYQAYGEYQLYYAYELRPFVQWCCEQDPVFYRSFMDYREMSTETIPGEDFRNVWTELAKKDYCRFEQDQQDFLIEHTLDPVLEKLTEVYGYDFVDSSDALKACVLSIANRQGRYDLDKYFHGTNAESNDREIIIQAYEEMQYYRSGERRWLREEVDCLALLDGEVDIYQKDENDAGGIDWTWKK